MCRNSDKVECKAKKQKFVGYKTLGRNSDKVECKDKNSLCDVRLPHVEIATKWNVKVGITEAFAA